MSITQMQLTGACVTEEAVGLCAWLVPGTFRIKVPAIESPAADLQSRYTPVPISDVFCAGPMVRCIDHGRAPECSLYDLAMAWLFASRRSVGATSPGVTPRWPSSERGYSRLLSSQIRFSRATKGP